MSSVTTESSQLIPDISDVIKPHTLKYNPEFSFSIKFHTEEKDLDHTDGVLLNSIYIIRDYKTNISDYIEVQLTIPLGTYVYDIYKHLNNIEVTITTIKQLYKEEEPYYETERYKAIYLVDKNTAHPTRLNVSKDDLNQNFPIVLTLQLLDRSVETLRIKTTQGSFDKNINAKNKDMSIKSFLKSIISEESNKILIENKPSLDNVSIEEPDNKDQLKAIVIPSSTRIIEIPEYIQTKNIGVYNAGIGNYIQKFGIDHYNYKKIFFVYSLFDPSKYDKSEYKTIIYIPPTSSHSITEVTYKYEDKVIKVLSHTLSSFLENKETQSMSTGIGFRTSNSNSYMKKPVEITPKGPVFKRGQLNTEIISKDRKDNLNFSPNRSVSNNHLALTSEILEKEGTYITLELSNVDHDFIYPGAPCKINYEDSNNELKEAYGVIHGAIINYSTNNMNMPLNYNSDQIALTSHILLQVFVKT